MLQLQAKLQNEHGPAWSRRQLSSHSESDAESARDLGAKSFRLFAAGHSGAPISDRNFETCRRAVDGFAQFHGCDPSRVKLSEVAGSSAGLQGWAKTKGGDTADPTSAPARDRPHLRELRVYRLPCPLTLPPSHIP